MDDFGFGNAHDDSGDFSPWSAEPRQEENIADLESRLNIEFVNTEFRCPPAIKLLKEPAFDISLLREYHDHDDHYNDLLTKKFERWYPEDNNSEMCKLFVVGCLERYYEGLVNNTLTKKHFSFNDYLGGFKSHRLELFRDQSKSNHIPGWATPRLGRMSNVWIRKNFPADGGYLVATYPLGKKFPPCDLCGSYFDSGLGATVPGKIWLEHFEGRQHD